MDSAFLSYILGVALALVTAAGGSNRIFRFVCGVGACGFFTYAYFIWARPQGSELYGHLLIVGLSLFAIGILAWLPARKFLRISPHFWIELKQIVYDDTNAHDVEIVVKVSIRNLGAKGSIAKTELMFLNTGGKLMRIGHQRLPSSEFFVREEIAGGTVVEWRSNQEVFAMENMFISRREPEARIGFIYGKFSGASNVTEAVRRSVYLQCQDENGSVYSRSTPVDIVQGRITWQHD